MGQFVFCAVEAKLLAQVSPTFSQEIEDRSAGILTRKSGEAIFSTAENHQFTDGYASCGRKKQTAAAGIRLGEKNRSCWTARQFSALPCTWDNP